MSTVLKADHPLLERSQAEALNLDDLEAVGKRIIQGARTKARQLLAEAQEQAEQLRRSAAEAGAKDGFEKGHRQGLQQGREEALAQATDRFERDQGRLVEALQSALAEFEDQRNRLLAGARDEMVRLAIAIARRVAKRYAVGDTRVAVENLKEIIERVGQRHVAHVKVNPADGESIRRFASGLAEASERWRNVIITESPEVEPGGAQVMLPDGEIDASLETQLDRVAAALLPGDQQP
jgi:flagellar assembly protein FliH